MKPESKFKFGRRKKLGSVLGLVLDGSRLDGVVLKHAGSTLQVLQSFSATLTLDPLTAAPELVGREIRNQLDAAGVRERNCVCGIPLRWVMTAHTELPPLSEADAAGLLQIEAERGFHADTATLYISDSRSLLAGDKKSILFAAVPRTHIETLEKVLAAAKLKPASFSLGLTALQPAASDKSNGVLALFVGETNTGLQVTCGKGVVALRTLEGTVGDEAGRRSLHTDIIAREVRITLGQLPAELRDAVKRIRIFGGADSARQLADDLESRFGSVGLRVEVVARYAPDEFGAQFPAETALSPAFSLAAACLTEQKPAFEFLPPKPGVIEQFMTKYSSGRLRTAGLAGAGAVAIVLGLFLFQQIELWHYQSQWLRMKSKVAELDAITANIHQYRPWYDTSYPTLSILRELSMVFPQEGSVTAKTIQIHDGDTIVCTGTARDYASLLAVQSALQKTPGVSELKLQQIRGRAPMIFQFGFKFNNGGGQ